MMKHEMKTSDAFAYGMVVLVVSALIGAAIFAAGGKPVYYIAAFAISNIGIVMMIVGAIRSTIIESHNKLVAMHSDEEK